jgi:pimeloyl-ACP methyl ester carboxylesterase
MVVQGSTHAWRRWRRNVPRALASGVLILLLASAAWIAAQRMVMAAPPAAQSDFAGLVDIGGRRLYLECRGTGSPTVILESGYGGGGDGWSQDLLEAETPRSMVLPAVAGFTRVCAYDRPGTLLVRDDAPHPSRSDPVPMPRTAEDLVTDLHALLEAAGVPGPYVLIGHSLGGLVVRLYASTYPDAVAGLVLVDGLSEQLQSLLTPEHWAAYVRNFLLLPPWLEAYGLEAFRDFERIDFAASAAQMRQAATAAPLRPLPLSVLAKSEPFDVPPDTELGFPMDALDRAWQLAQDELPTLVPNARFTIASRSGHNIHQDQPALVIEAIRQVVAGVRDPSTWYDLGSCCAP